MKIDVDQNRNYKKLHSLETSLGTLKAWQSMQPVDDQWDNFLAATPGSHFNQTSIWAEVRRLDGWVPYIIIITLNDDIVGGFQMLWRSKSYIGKIGLILKGPLIASDNPIIIKFILQMLKHVTKINNIRALIIQPPDRDKVLPDFLTQSDFSNNHIDHIIKTNTVSINLCGTLDDIFKRIKRTKRQNINTAVRKGVTVRQGHRSDLDVFFKLMIETCKRQKVAPSPSNVNFLYKLWDLFSRKENIRLFIAEMEGEIIACLLVLPFGDTAYLWKFGWSGKYPKYHPNIITYWEIFKWAKASGYHFADLGAISTDLADVIWRGQTATEEMSKTYSYFKTSFGGDIIRLTKGFVYISNPFVRMAYNVLMPRINAVPQLKKRLLFSE